jgi:hypothetical protein
VTENAQGRPDEQSTPATGGTGEDKESGQGDAESARPTEDADGALRKDDAATRGR